MKVYNTKFLRGNQRLVVAILVGLLSSIACAAVYALLVSLLRFNTSLYYIGMAYAISYCIKTYGRGVDTKYSIIGTCFTLFSILLGKSLLMIIPFGFNFTLLPMAIMAVIQSSLIFNTRALIELVFIAYALYIAYYNSRIV